MNALGHDESGVKGSSGFQHTEGDMKQLAHGGCDDGHLAQAACQQAFTESMDPVQPAGAG